ncbi:energy-coupling factor ABC transporter ATP-binding protein [Halovivax gelatinilyticus]|uniref:energy-coupling factor ABC transporter ATP-binding protein n=1 Tax=Halovivax gelatinilyticus TaxID=2961597 RepID=UPI0020CA878A|nr:ABC transporter ATP-binding protein [Halovivax gelatinilyticus]
MIEFDDVSFAYGGANILHSVSLTIDDGEFVVLVGPNGSGKTTLLRHTNGLLEPADGRVRVDGTPVAADLVAARSAVGMVFQHPRDQFVAATVAADVAFGPENLGLERDVIDDRVERALEAVNMNGRGDERIDELSGGEQSRVAIAGALAMAPSHLVLDEPFSGLDDPARRSVREQLASLSASGTGVIVSTHDPAEVIDLADRVIAMADGHVAIDDEPDRAMAELAASEIGVRTGSER